MLALKNNTNFLKTWGFLNYFLDLFFRMIRLKTLPHMMEKGKRFKREAKTTKNSAGWRKENVVFGKTKTKCKYQEKDEWHISQCDIADVVAQVMDIGSFRNGNLPRLLSSSTCKNEEFEGSQVFVDHALSGPCSSCGVHSCTGQGGKGSQKKRNPWTKVWG